MPPSSRATVAVVEHGAARAVFGDRTGGVSMPPFASRNVGDHVGDDPDAVAENRRRFARAAFGPDAPEPTTWSWLQQVHGAAVHVVTGAPATPSAGPPTADAALTTVRNHVVAVVTADCAPVALLSEEAVAVVHAGHRGVRAGVVERAVRAMRDHTRAPVHAVIGPTIRPARYEFGADDLEAFVARFGPSAAATTAHGAPALDLVACVRRALAEMGVEAIDDVAVCTAASPSHFSYRRDGRTGRQATAAVLRP